MGFRNVATSVIVGEREGIPISWCGGRSERYSPYLVMKSLSTQSLILLLPKFTIYFIKKQRKSRD
jgi:hypothetical protein